MLQVEAVLSLKDKREKINNHLCRSNLDYIIFECLAERTIGLAKQEMLKDPTLTLASLRYEYGWTSNDADKMGQCVLAGHGYNVTTFNVPVTYCGTNDEIKGQYQLAIWENHADPIICGREQLGYSKIYADITDICRRRRRNLCGIIIMEF